MRYGILKMLIHFLVTRVGFGSVKLIVLTQSVITGGNNLTKFGAGNRKSLFYSALSLQKCFARRQIKLEKLKFPSCCLNAALICSFFALIPNKRVQFVSRSIYTAGQDANYGERKTKLLIKIIRRF